MKKLTFTLVGLFLLMGMLCAQAPQKIKFQGVARDGNNDIIKDDNIILIIEIIKGDPGSGEVVLVDQGTPAMNTNTGVFTVNIGENVQEGSMEDILWQEDEYFIRPSIIYNGQTIELGFSQILSVPYALYGADEDANPENEIQILDFNTATRTLSVQPGGSSVVIPDNGDNDTSTIDELQTLSRSGTTVTLSNNGGSVSIEDNDSSPTNEIQSLTSSGSTLILSNGGGEVAFDNSTVNELQSLVRSGNELTLSNGGDPVSINDADADPNNELQSITRSGSSVTLSDGGGQVSINDNDSDPNNEIQTISLNAANQLILSSGGSVDLSGLGGSEGDPTDELQTITRSGDNVILSDGGGTVSIRDDDSSTSNELQEISRSGSTITLSDGGGSVSVNDNDASTSNELQSITRSGSTITLSDGGGQVSINDDDSIVGNELQFLTYSAGTNQLTLSNGGGTVTLSGAGGDPTDELQTITRSGSTITLSDGGGSVSVNDSDASTSNEIQSLSYNAGSNVLTLSNGGGSVNLSDLQDGGGGGGSVWDQNGTTATYSDGHVSVGGQTASAVPGGSSGVEDNSLLVSGNVYAGLRNGTFGEVLCYDEDTDLAVSIIGSSTNSVANGAGFHLAYGPNGNFNSINAISQTGSGNHGYFSVNNSSGSPAASFFIFSDGSGSVEAAGANGGVKSFVMPHPENDTKEIVYVSLEGPEAAAYERGTAELVNGEAEIIFSETFEIVASPETMTIMTSPWSAESKGLAIIERTARGFKVKELFGGNGNYKFDWEVKAVRKGWENFKPVRDKRPVFDPRKGR